MASKAKAKKKNLPKSTTEMSKEMLQETLKKKRECNARALLIVEKLSEGHVEEEWLLKNLEFINQCHFEDAIVERALLKFCGYPLCDNILGEIPTKQYHISTRYNKVFDITERKNFCSSICYKAAMFLKKQLLTSPLWFRDKEVIPNFVLLKCSSSAMGEEIKMREKIEIEVDSNVADDNNKSSIDNNETNNKEISFSNEVNEDLMQKLKISDESEKSEELEARVSESFEKDVERTEKIVDSCDKSKTKERKNRKTEDETIIQFKNEPVIKNEPIAVQESLQTHKSEPEPKLPQDPVSRVEQCIFQWFNLSTMLFLLGEDKVKTLFSDKVDELKEVLKCTTITRGCSERIDRMINFFSIMDIQLSNDSAIKELKPLPDYSFIKEEGKNLEVKVKAFYKGQLEIEPPEVDKDKDIKEDEEPDIYLPLVDTHAQNALRRRILLDKLNRIIPELLRTLSPDFTLEMAELRNLVTNFTLEAHNITFKPAEWYLVGVILIKLLSLKIKRLNLLLSTAASQKHITLLLMSYHLKEDYLDKIVEWLTDRNSIIKKLNMREQI